VDRGRGRRADRRGTRRECRDHQGQRDCGYGCDDGVCTLREAIVSANTNAASGATAGECAAGEASPTVDTIAFAIAGAGVHTISPTSQLPHVTESVVIDGYNQAGSSANSNPPTQGLNTVLTIELNGAMAGNSAGLILDAGNCTVRGLVIDGF
jgi:hypothetical protein